MPNPLMQLTSHLWVSQSKAFEYNSGIISSQEHLCFIDPGLFPAEIEALAAFGNEREIESRVLVLTHSHWDHLLGTDHFPDARLIAQENYLDEVQEEGGRRIYQQVEKWTAEHDPNPEQPFVIPLPEETFLEAMRLFIGDLSLELIHAPGHAADQLVLYLPGEAALWASDMLSDSEIPYVIHSLTAYEATLAKLSALEIKALVPGHGTPTSEADEIQARISADRAYLANLRDQVTRAIAQGLTIIETAAETTGFQHHQVESNANAHQLNIESAYLELGGTADPANFGWRKSTD